MILSGGLILRPDTSPFTSGALTTSALLIDGSWDTAQLLEDGASRPWTVNDAYGADAGASTRLVAIRFKGSCSETYGIITGFVAQPTFSVFTSTDNTAWTLVGSVTAAFVSGDLGEYIMELLLPDSTYGRYVKAVFTSAGSLYGLSGWGIINEVEVYGVEGVSDASLLRFDDYINDGDVDASLFLVEAFAQETITGSAATALAVLECETVFGATIDAPLLTLDAEIIGTTAIAGEITAELLPLGAATELGSGELFHVECEAAGMTGVAGIVDASLLLLSAAARGQCTNHGVADASLLVLKAETSNMLITGVVEADLLPLSCEVLGEALTAIAAPELLQHQEAY